MLVLHVCLLDDKAIIKQHDLQIMLCTCIQEVLGSNLDWDTSYPEVRGFPQSLHKNAETVSCLGHFPYNSPNIL
jgi:hypothetical protein